MEVLDLGLELDKEVVVVDTISLLQQSAGICSGDIEPDEYKTKSGK